ncbi:MAG: HAMP domain-containing protein [Alphaproteobacteria bacterium]|nr:HAMP domain-containing protein [Alphaproteobacteria bacterium]
MKKISSLWVRSLKRKLLPNHLLGRFVAISFLPLISLEIALGGFFYARHWDALSHRLARDISGEIQSVAEWVDMTNLSDSEIQKNLKRLGTNLALEFSWKPNQFLPDQVKKRASKMVKPLKSELSGIHFPFQLHDSPYAEQTISVQLKRGILQVVVPRKRFFSSTVLVFLGLMIVSTLICFGIAFLFMKNQVRSMVRLAKAAEMFGLGQMDYPFKPEGATEVRQAGASFLQMRSRIQRYLKERTNMLAGVSHDLRTPLTRLKLQLEMLSQNTTTKDMQQDVAEMDQMLNGYLTFARGEGREESSFVEMSPFLNSLIDKFKKTGHDIELHAKTEARIYGRPTDLSRAFGNIINNATRYGTKTQIQLQKKQGMIHVIIDDNGPGIPAKKRIDVFKPFYRLDSARNSQTGGVGLGLTIARDTILSHGGEIRLETSPLKGLRVIISLPESQSKALK